jgi:ribosomal protein L11 methyltransferase
VSDEPGVLLRARLTAQDGAEAEETLRARAAEAFPAGFEEERDEAGRLVVAGYGAAPLRLPDGLGSWTVDVVEAGWETRWRAFHHGAPVGRLWVGPPWERPGPGLVPVVIDPGRAFGTGQHGTTRACLELLCEIEPDGAVLDLGCGSGVLAIAAARLGFAPVRACDLDPLAVAATQLNAAANGVEVEVFEADVLREPLPAAALWLANILRRPLEQLFARTDARPLRAILSGIRLDEPVVPEGYREVARAERDGWLALHLERCG